MKQPRELPKNYSLLEKPVETDEVSDFNIPRNAPITRGRLYPWNTGVRIVVVSD